MPKKISNKTSNHNKEQGESKAGRDQPRRDITLSEEDAIASSPADESVCGEEDPGAGLEFLVKSDKFKPPSGTD